jgi:hypothetical protein
MKSAKQDSPKKSVVVSCVVPWIAIYPLLGESLGENMC